MNNKVTAIRNKKGRPASLWAVLLMVVTVAFTTRLSAQTAEDALASLSLEQLTRVQVVSASGYLQGTEEAPASVSIVTAGDIQTFGYRTLADILRSVRSLFVTSDRNYSSLGVRGIARPGDYNTRVLLLIDGHRMNDDVYDQAMIGTEFPLDVDIIERVEIVRGPVSSLYGSNALLGVINVITKRGEDLKTSELAVSAASFRADQLRLTFGAHKGRFDLLATSTLYRSKGHNTLFYPEFDTPATNNGIADRLDGDQVRSGFLSASDGDVTLHALFGTRDKQIPTAPYGTLFNAPGTHTIDTHTLFDLQSDHAFASDWKLLSRGFYDIYHYAGTYLYASDTDMSQRSPEIDAGYSQWAGAEVKATKTLPRSMALAGLEFRDNFRQNQKTFDLNPYTLDLDNQRASYVVAPYAQFEGPLSRVLKVNAGVRYDYYSDTAGSWDPRAALVYRPVSRTVLRFTYGGSFRAPNVYERFYAVAPNAANPSLLPERVRTVEALWDQQLPAHLTFSTSVFHTAIHGLISEVGDAETAALTFQNAQSVTTRGVEAELKAHGAKGSSLGLSYTFQESRDRATDALLSNSPRSLGKLTASSPLPKVSCTGSIDAQYVARMETVSGPSASPYTVVNATLLSKPLWRHLTVAASAYNLLDKHFADPAPGFNQQAVIAQDGRNLRLKLTWQLGRTGP